MEESLEGDESGEDEEADGDEEGEFHTCKR
jgi:hypothetical protein